MDDMIFKKSLVFGAEPYVLYMKNLCAIYVTVYILI